MLAVPENTQDFIVVNRKITQRERHNGVFFFVNDLIPQKNEVLNPFETIPFTRQETGTAALLLRLKDPQYMTLLGNACEEAHLTLDEKFYKGDDLFSHAHFRGIFSYGTQKLKIGVYFDDKGNFLRLEVTILDGTQKIKLSKDEPLFIQIEKEITPHYLPFQTLLTTINTLKSDELVVLSQNITAKDLQLSHQLEEYRFDTQHRQTLIQDIQNFIESVKKVNAYDDNTQDMRYVPYETLLQDVSTTRKQAIALPSVISTDESAQSVQITPSSATQPDNILVENRLNKDRETITILVDAIVQALKSPTVAHLPKHDQFLQVRNQLSDLEMAFWLLLFDTIEEYSNEEFVKAQKQRLNGMLLSLDVYFAHNLDIHDEAAIKAFLPHLSQIQKMGHFNTLLDRIENTKGNNALELCTTARFLYKEDADFRSCFHKRQNTIKVYTIQNSLVYLTILVRLFLNKNTEGFRLLIENHDNLHYPQFIFHHKQFTILSTCILYSNNPIAADCIKLLLAQGVTISQPIEVYPENKLQHVVALSKARHSTQDITPINLTVTQLSSIIEDGLAFAIENRFENLDLIKLLAEHSSLERILINLAHLSLNELFNFRICNSQVAVFAVLTDVNQCNVVTNQIRAIKNVSSLACLFYHVDPNAEDIMHRFDIIDILAGPYKTKADQTSDQDIRDLTNKFIVQAKQAQSHPDELVISLKYVHAGLLAWLQIKDFNADDYKMALQLLYLRGMINSRVYRSHADELALMSYGTAINLIDYLPDSLSVELKQSKLYQLHCSATKLCSDRLKERHQSGLFTQTNGAQTANPTINMALQRK